MEQGSSLILNADCIYAPEIVGKMMAAETSCIAADSGMYVEENMKIKVDSGRIVEISKKLKPGVNTHTSIDIYNFNNSDLQKLKKKQNGL